MNLELNGKRALVTGSSSGIGAEIARTLAREGVAVVVHGRNSERANLVAQEITREGGQAFVAVGDLANGDEARAVGDAVATAIGGVDILINNVGGGGQFTTWMDTDPEAWLASYQINVVSAVRMIQRCVPQMRERGWGRVIQLASSSATQPNPTLPDYQAAKAAVVNLTVSLSKALGGTGITVNTVTPGTILTPGLEKYFRGIAQARGWGTDLEEIEKRAVAELYPNPSGRVGRIRDVATLVTFVASPLAGFINGANLRVDGGRIPSIN